MIYPFNFSFSFSLLFMGFLLSNLFGILGSSKNIVLLFILYIELTNYFVYTTVSKKAHLLSETQASMKPFSLLRRKISGPQRSLLSNFPLKFKKSVELLFYKPFDKRNKYQQPRTQDASLIRTILNFFKIGLEFGFFIDAFKLGS